MLSVVLGFLSFENCAPTNRLFEIISIIRDLGFSTEPPQDISLSKVGKLILCARNMINVINIKDKFVHPATRRGRNVDNISEQEGKIYRRCISEMSLVNIHNFLAQYVPTGAPLFHEDGIRHHSHLGKVPPTGETRKMIRDMTPDERVYFVMHLILNAGAIGNIQPLGDPVNTNLEVDLAEFGPRAFQATIEGIRRMEFPPMATILYAEMAIASFYKNFSNRIFPTWSSYQSLCDSVQGVDLYSTGLPAPATHDRNLVCSIRNEAKSLTACCPLCTFSPPRPKTILEAKKKLSQHLMGQHSYRMCLDCMTACHMSTYEEGCLKQNGEDLTNGHLRQALPIPVLSFPIANPYGEDPKPQLLGWNVYWQTGAIDFQGVAMDNLAEEALSIMADIVSGNGAVLKLDALVRPVQHLDGVKELQQEVKRSGQGSTRIDHAQAATWVLAWLGHFPFVHHRAHPPSDILLNRDSTMAMVSDSTEKLLTCPVSMWKHATSCLSGKSIIYIKQPLLEKIRHLRDYLLSSFQGKLSPNMQATLFDMYFEQNSNLRAPFLQQAFATLNKAVEERSAAEKQTQIFHFESLLQRGSQVKEQFVSMRDRSEAYREEYCRLMLDSNLSKNYAILSKSATSAVLKRKL